MAYTQHGGSSTQRLERLLLPDTPDSIRDEYLRLERRAKT